MEIDDEIYDQIEDKEYEDCVECTFGLCCDRPKPLEDRSCFQQRS